MRLLFICSSNKDRSPALVEYFSKAYPEHEYRSAGVNKYFCLERHITHYLTREDIEWADVVVFCEQVQKDIYNRDFKAVGFFALCDKEGSGFFEFREERKWMILGAGQYHLGSDDYLTQADFNLRKFIKL